jgi:hypothetical protein
VSSIGKRFRIVDSLKIVQLEAKLFTPLKVIEEAVERLLPLLPGIKQTS